jgi:hypothetical protein
MASLAELGQQVPVVVVAVGADRFVLIDGNRGDCERLLAAVGETRLSVRDVGALYTGYRRADAAGRARLLADPHLFLRACREAAPPALRDSDPAVALGKDLAALRALAWRAAQRIGQGALGAIPPQDRTPLGRAWRAAAAAFAALRAALEEGASHARSDDPHGDSPAA